MSMDRLIEGYRRFRAGTWPGERERYEALSAKGQQPETLVIACSDSRVDPQTVFGAGPGELFVVRNVAGLVPPYEKGGGHHGTSAALEYGVRVLGVTQIVVLGHGQCGGVQAMLHGAPEQARDFVDPWMGIARAAVRPLAPDSEPDKVLLHYETEVVRISLVNLMTFPWIAEAVAVGNLTVSGYRFAIHDGVLMRLKGDRFLPVD